jgi:acyl-CoA synthetase (NDP forming)/ribonuclease HI
MEFFFNPKSVAIVGASRNPMKFGSVIMANLLNLGYEGKIYPVNARGEDIAGEKTYTSVTAIPDEVELAIFSVPASKTIQVMRECAEKRVRGVVIISSGFDESGAAGAAYQRELLGIAKQAGIRIIGPNTTGILNPYDNFTTTFVPLRDVRKGPVAFIAQTGMFAGMLLEWILSSECVGISKVIGLGNKCDVDDADALEYLAGDERTKVIMMYVESVKDGRRFMQAARAVTRRKPILALKSGRTAEGAAAAMSHTGSLAGNDEIVSGAFRQVGIQRVDAFQKLIDRAKLFAYQPVARGNRLAIVSLSGGAAVMSTDAALAAGFQLARFSPEALASVQKHYPPWATVRHPFDIEPLTETVGFQPAFEMALRCAFSNPETDACLVVTWAPIPETGYAFDFVRTLQEEYPGKPLVLCGVGYKENYEALFRQLESQGIPVYSNFTRAIDALAASLRYGQYVRSLAPQTGGNSSRPNGKPNGFVSPCASRKKNPSVSKRGDNPGKDCRRLVIYFDGASRGNPGPAAIGVVISTPEGETVIEIGDQIGETTNNYAEYTALIRALEEARRLGAVAVECLSDSELVVRQMTGVYKVRSQTLLPLIRRAQSLSREFKEFAIDHVPRSMNRRADALASEALKKKA